MKLLDQAVSGASPVFRYSGTGRPLNLYLAGELDGALVSVEAQLPDGSDWVPVADGELTAPGLHTLIAAPFVGRLAIVGAGVATAVSAWVETESTGVFNRVVLDKEDA